MITHNNLNTGTLTVALATLVAATSMTGCTDLDEEIPEAEAYDIMREVEEPDIVDEVDSVWSGEMISDATCTLEARPAAIVSVYQREGQTLEPLGDDALVLYRRWTAENGWGDTREALCADASCTTASIGHGAPGYYLVGAFGCGDYSLTGIEVDMMPSGCHVDTVHAPVVLENVSPMCMSADELDAVPQQGGEAQGELTETLSAEFSEIPVDDAADQMLPDNECPLEAPNPSVVAMTGVIEQDIVWPEQAETVQSRHRNDAQAVSMSCLNEPCNLHIGDFGRTGTFDVSAMICGERVHEIVEVEPSDDGCNVDTEWVGLFAEAEEACEPNPEFAPAI